MIYDLDREEYIEESAIEEVEDTNDVLDNMLEACEYMMDMLGLDESKHGNAFDRAMNIAADKYTKMKNKADAEEIKGDKLRRIADSNSTGFGTGHTAARMADSHYKNAKEYNYKKDKIYSSEIEPYKYSGGVSKHNARRNWKHDINSNGGYRVPANGGKFKTSEGLSSKYEAKDQKKKAVKEACLAILSALDDIE